MKPWLSRVLAGFAIVGVALAAGACADSAGPQTGPAAASQSAPDQTELTNSATTLKIDPIVIPINHSGAYNYTSDPLSMPFAGVPHAVGSDSKVIGGDVTLGTLTVRVQPNDNGQWVLNVNFVVTEFSGDNPALRINPPFVTPPNS